MRRVTLLYKVLTACAILLGTTCIAWTYQWVYPTTPRVHFTADLLVTRSAYGLEIGSPVFYIGHQVGSVKSIALQGDCVTVQLAFHEEFTINSSTYARFELRDFQLRKVVMVYTPVLEAPAISDTGVGLQIPLNESSAIDNIPEELLKVIRRVEGVLKEIEGILQGTQEKVGRALSNADKASEDLRVSARQLSQMLQKFSKTRLWRWLAG